MAEPVLIYAVDDEPQMQVLLDAILGDHYAVETFGTAEACLQRLATTDQRPEMVLIDVGLPGMDGYALCRRIKDDARTAHIPVAFISGHDTIEARLRGYEAGGEDFIVKPFEPEELLSKLKVALRLFEEQEQLRARASYAEHTALSAMSTLGSLGAVIEFLRKSFACTNGGELGNALLDALKQYGLQGAVRIHMGGTAHTMSLQGASLPLEASILDYVSTLGRIFEFQKRAVFNFGGITLLVSNMPIDNAERCGSLRDNLAILAEGADARRQAIEFEEARRRTQQGLLKAVDKLQGTLDAMRVKHQREQFSVTQLVIDVQEDMVHSFVQIGLSEGQESFVIDLVKRHIGQILDQIAQGDDIVVQLEELAATLRNLAA